jgi:hypothetical protein
MAKVASAPQFTLPGLCQLRTAIDDMALAGVEDRGAIFTKREVVDFILDLVGYQTSQRLIDRRLLEPSFGGGEFLFAAVDRLIATVTDFDDVRLDGAICGIELHRMTFESTKKLLFERLVGHGLTPVRARHLTATWLISDDFLLTDIEQSFDTIIGNPPYVRQERIPDVLIAEYRRRFSTVFDRADLYVPFMERSLSLLSQGGALGFICADRWMKNRYGGPLRQFVLDDFHLRAYVDMVDTQAFHTDVVAYPAIFVIAREVGNITRIAKRPAIDAAYLGKLAIELSTGEYGSSNVRQLGPMAKGGAPWLLENDDQLELVRRLEQSLPTLAEVGCSVGIGVATGADKAFIGPFEWLDVEEDRKIPLVTTRDILNGAVEWAGLGVINPFAEAGGLVRLEEYPKLQRYLQARKEQISGRHVAVKNPVNWYRTIDRIYPALVSCPKLLIPDIKGEAHIVYDEGKFYPHHNLYYILSDQWDLRALQTVLSSGIANLFVSAYSTKMRGGYLRYQAQYLRRIRVPHWSRVPQSARDQLANAGWEANTEIAQTVADLFGLSAVERDRFLTGNKAI